MIQCNRTRSTDRIFSFHHHKLNHIFHERNHPIVKKVHFQLLKDKNQENTVVVFLIKNNGKKLKFKTSILIHIQILQYFTYLAYLISIRKLQLMIKQKIFLCWLVMIEVGNSELVGSKVLFQLEDMPWCLKMSNDSKFLFAVERGDYSAILIYINNKEGFDPYRILQFNSTVQYFDLSPSQNTLAVHIQGFGISFLETKNFSEIQFYSYLESNFKLLQFSDDEEYVVFAASTGLNILQKNGNIYQLSQTIMIDSFTILVGFSNRFLVVSVFQDSPVIYENIGGSFILKKSFTFKFSPFIKITDKELIFIDNEAGALYLYGNDGNSFSKISYLELGGPVFPVSGVDDASIIYSLANYTTVLEINRHGNEFSSKNIGTITGIPISVIASKDGLYFIVGFLGGKVQAFYKCPSECSSCSFPNNCEGCKKDHILKDGICHPRPTHCVKNQFLINSICKEYCAKKCETCNQTRNDCFECSENYEKNKEGDCVLATNTIGILTRIRPVFNLARRGSLKCIFFFLDDLWLYQYHQTQYKGDVGTILKTLRFIEEKQWEIVGLEDAKDRVENSLPISNKYNSYSNEKYMMLQRKNNLLLQNLMCFFAFFIPAALILVLICRKVFFLLWNYRISKILRPYSFWLILLEIFVINNIEFFSFLGFRAWQVGFSFGIQSKILVGFSTLLFFITIFAAFGGYLLIYCRYGNLGKYFLLNMHNKTSSYVLMNLSYGIKPFVKGLVHSILFEEPCFQLYCLMAIQLFFLLMVFCFQFCLENYKSTVLFMLESIYSACLVLFNVVLILQFHYLDPQEQAVDRILNDACTVLIWMMVGCIILRILWDLLDAFFQCVSSCKEEETEEFDEAAEKHVNQIQDMIVVNEQELLPVTPVQSARESLRKQLQHQIINFYQQTQKTQKKQKPSNRSLGTKKQQHKDLQEEPMISSVIYIAKSQFIRHPSRKIIYSNSSQRFHLFIETKYPKKPQLAKKNTYSSQNIIVLTFFSAYLQRVNFLQKKYQRLCLLSYIALLHFFSSETQQKKSQLSFLLVTCQILAHKFKKNFFSTFLIQIKSSVSIKAQNYYVQQRYLFKFINKKQERKRKENLFHIEQCIFLILI